VKPGSIVAETSKEAHGSRKAVLLMMMMMMMMMI
jgi:hypothetical protein